MGYWATKAYANRKCGWDESHSFGREAEQLQEEWDATLFMGFLLCLHWVTSASRTNKGKFLPWLHFFALSHMWAGGEEAKHSSCQLLYEGGFLHWCETLRKYWLPFRLRRYWCCIAKKLYLRFCGAWVKAFWLGTREQETARLSLRLFVLSNTFCLLMELAWKPNQHSFFKRIVHSEWG